jgi:serine/threonine protein kinase/Tfp pilus assembly protein PilF
MTNSGTYIGKQIGNYRIVTEIASSYFSHVFRGEHVYLPQFIVAIKLLHAYLDSPQESERFLQEAQFLAMLKHRHIMPVIDVGIYEGLPYLVVEYAQNGSLRDRLRRHPSPRPLPLDEALTILLQVGQALQYAHEMDVVHRDLKPENVLFNSRNEALLADFNIATVLETAKTKSIDIIGSPLYMAPEQFEGIISKRSDLYALGCIAYELFTGRPPFNAPSAFALGLKHKNEDPHPPTHLNPHLPRQIEQAILKALAKERVDRHISVSVFVTALQRSTFQKPTEQSETERIIQGSLKRCEETLSTYQHAILNPDSAIFHAKRGDLLYDLKRDEEALAAYEQAVQLDPHLALAYEGKGNALYYCNRFEEALAAYEQAIQLDPHLAKAYDGKGWALWHLKRYEEALKAFDSATDLDSHNFSAHHGKGNVLFELRRYQEAAAAYQEAIRRKPRLIFAYFGKGNALFEIRLYNEALAAYEEAIQRDPRFAYAYNGKANSLWRLNRYEDALAAYDQAISSDPSTALYYRNKGRLLKSLGKIKEAEQAFEKARQLGYNG